jgi:hypothetical protein
MLSNDQGQLAGDLINVASGRIDVAALANQIAGLAVESETYEAKARIAREIAPRFGMAGVVQRYARVYEGVLNQRDFSSSIDAPSP